MPDLLYWTDNAELAVNVQATPLHVYSGTWAEWEAWKAAYGAAHPPTPTPDWVSFRRDLIPSTAFQSLGVATMANPALSFLWSPLTSSVIPDNPDPATIAGIWNPLQTQNGQQVLSQEDIDWIAAKITEHNIPLSIANDGTITVVGG